jgi:sigma-B regulation protein RsbU (phosphoserine phosphatase)
MFATSRYTVSRVRLEPHDSLLLYTDGISEARNSAGEEYGIAGISRDTAGRHGWEPRDLVAACMADVEKHSSGVRPVDDQTLMVIHRGVAAEAAFND